MSGSGLDGCAWCVRSTPGGYDGYRGIGGGKVRARVLFSPRRKWDGGERSLLVIRFGELPPITV
jgi:hypothetical protein